MKQRVMRASKGLLFFLVSSAVGAQEERLLRLVQPAVEQRLATLAGSDAPAAVAARVAPVAAPPRARFAEAEREVVRLAAHHPGEADCPRARRHRIAHPGRLS